jgi:DNA-binding transcriptional ArsR family regulator
MQTVPVMLDGRATDEPLVGLRRTIDACDIDLTEPRSWSPRWAQPPICAIVTSMPNVRDELYQLHASVCKGFADPKRLILINALRNGELSVKELSAITGISQSNASQHLAILKGKGLVTSRREGQRVYYTVTSTKINEALDLLLEVMAEQMHIPAVSTS